MSQFNAPSYDIQRPTGQCALTGRALVAGETYMATLVDVPVSCLPQAGGDEGFQRVDVCMEAWDQGQRPAHIFSYWKSIVPLPNQKKKIFVDDQVLLDIFHRLADATEPSRQAFRFVLGLILMRKKWLRYDGTTQRPDACGQSAEHWIMIPKGPDAEPIFLLNPHLDDAKIQQVIQQLSEILQSEL